MPGPRVGDGEDDLAALRGERDDAAFPMRGGVDDQVAQRAAQAERAGLDRDMIKMVDRHRVAERRHLGLDVADQPVHRLDRIQRLNKSP
ncbi:hypothetical protein [Mesorhizobium sp.]|uniref:hypothetical protein n=1 Tax=Mesorhizobium sp. TaxID=1871066 RepID=UPI0025F7D9F5|nr:hypothetical protein [Mesorhizobium sp.]